MTKEQWIGMEEAAKKYQVVSEHIYKWCEKGEVTYSKIDEYIMIDENSLETCLQRHLCLSLSTEELQRQVDRIMKEHQDKTFILQSLTELTPLMRMIIRELADTIPNPTRRRMFLYMTLEGNLKEFAKDNCLGWNDMSAEYRRLIREINARAGFLMRYKDRLAVLQARLRLYEEEFGKDAVKEIKTKRQIIQSEEEKKAMELLDTGVYDVGFGDTLAKVLANGGLFTLRDIIKFIYRFGSNKMLKMRGMGRAYQASVVNRLCKIKVLDEEDNSYLYKYLTEEEKENTPHSIYTGKEVDEVIRRWMGIKED